MRSRTINKSMKSVLSILTFILLTAMMPSLRADISTVIDDPGQPPRLPEMHVPGRVLVKFHQKVGKSRARNVITSMGGISGEEIRGTGVHVVELPEGLNEEFFLDVYRSQPEVEFAELDLVLPPDEMVPDDPTYPSEWHLPKIASPSAWSMTTGNSNIVIAILDTGIDLSHPDLAGKLVPGWNIWDNNPDTSDVYGHGTAVAGTAAASSNNTQGVASVAWGCQIMPVRISDLNGFGYASTVAMGLNWAADHGARVANVSYKFSNSLTVRNAAQNFQNRGGVVVMSAGNDGAFDSSADNPYVLTVSGTTVADVIISWSNRGNNIDLAAPGAGIWTTNRGGGYGSWNGTSFSSPIVAGVAGLVLSVNPGLSGSQAQEILKRSADDLGSAGWDSSYGWGRVNAANAVTLAGGSVTPPPPPPIEDTTAPVVNITSPSDGSRVAAKVNVRVNASDDTGVTRVEFYVDGRLVARSTSSPFTFGWDTRKLSKGAHSIHCRAYDAAGNVGASPSVTVFR
ncbi:MAG TPA: S8 family serine peptidase [Blastocatellia bacterium]|nr:S8 family serine peptidase [Blastocatellia bacterium]